YGDNGNDTITLNTAGQAVSTTIFGGNGNDVIRLNHSAFAHKTVIGDFAATDIIQVTLSGGATAASLTVTGVGSSPTIADAANEEISFANFNGNFTATNFVLSDGSRLLTNGGSTSATLTGAAGAGQIIG